MRIFSFLLCLFLAFSLPVSVGANSEKIAAVVNQDVISRSDVSDRVKLIMMSSGLPNNPEIRTKLSQQVIGSLVEEQIKLQEAVRLEIETTPDEIAQGFATIARQNNFEPEKFSEILKGSGINKATMERQIKSQIAWGKVVQAKVRSRVRVSDRDVEYALERLKANAGKTEYLVAEVFLPIEDPKEDSNVRQLATRLASQIKNQQVPFFKVAQEFSKAAGATNGGDLGWIQGEQLDKAVSSAVKSMQKNTVSAPVRSNSGYHILFLRDSRLISDKNAPDYDEMKKTIGTERLERAQRRYYLDLKSASFIENRIDL